MQGRLAAQAGVEELTNEERARKRAATRNLSIFGYVYVQEYV
jgi:hypothetical protein